MLVIGDRLGRYELLERMGGRGFGVVWRARDVTIGRFVAIRVFDTGVGNVRECESRFHEAIRQGGANLSHSALPVIYDIEKIDGLFVVILQYIFGVTLENMRQYGKPLAVHEVADLLRPVASAIDYAHRNGVVHGVVRPRNILVEPHGSAWMMDFGLCRTWLSPEGVSPAAGPVSPVAGTLPYMAPEQVAGGIPEAASDRYAFGSIVYELLAGSAVVSAVNSEVLGQNRSWSPPASIRAVRPDLSKSLDQLIMRVLARKPIDRLGTATELIDELSRPTSVERHPDPTVSVEGGVAGMFEAVRGSVVRVETSNGAGSGVRVAEGILTNAHVVGSDPFVSIVTADGQRAWGRVALADESVDLALVRTELLGQAIDLADADALRIGQAVFVIGYPRMDQLHGQASLSAGVISGLRSIRGTRWVQSDASQNRGNSGGALVGADGRLVGVPSMSLRDTEGIHFSVSVAEVADFLGKLAPGMPRTFPSTKLIVDATGHGDVRTIADALRLAVLPETVIVVRPGVYRESLIVDRNVEIVGEGDRSSVIVEVRGAAAVSLVAERAVLRGLTVRVVGAGNFCAVAVGQGKTLVEDCDMSASDATSVRISGSNASPIFKGCQIRSHRSDGILFQDGATGELDDCVIYGNGMAGIAIESGANPTVRNCHIRDGQSSGILVHALGLGEFVACKITGNVGSGVSVRTGGNPTLSDCVITSCQGHGVLVRDNGKGTFTNCTLSDNTRGAWSIEAGSSVIRAGNMPNE